MDQSHFKMGRFDLRLGDFDWMDHRFEPGDHDGAFDVDWLADCPGVRRCDHFFETKRFRLRRAFDFCSDHFDHKPDHGQKNLIDGSGAC